MQICITIGGTKEAKRMKILTVTERGQVTLRKDVLQHLGIRPGEKIEWEKQPDSTIIFLRAARPLGKIDSFVGLLAGKTGRLRLDEMSEAAASGWSTLK